jgi:hypothetical protein
MLFFPANEAVRRVLFGMVITVVYMATLLVFKPYKRGVLNYLSATVAQFALLFSMIVALCMRIFIDVADRFNEKSAQAVMDFEGPSQVGPMAEQKFSGPRGNSKSVSCDVRDVLPRRW